METVTLYRVAHKILGIGPWCIGVQGYTKDLSYDAQVRMEQMYFQRPVFNLRQHVIIREDVKGFTDDFKCAAESIEQLKFWFNDELFVESLFDADFMLYEITIDKKYVKYGASGKQVAYDARQVIETKELDLLPLVA